MMPEMTFTNFAVSAVVAMALHWFLNQFMDSLIRDMDWTDDTKTYFKVAVFGMAFYWFNPWVMQMVKGDAKR